LLSAWRGAVDRWARVVEATLEDVCDVVGADPFAIACVPMPGAVTSGEVAA